MTKNQYFCKRKPTSTWSKINKEKIELLTANGLMTEAGLNVIEIAKQNGSWCILDDVEELIVPQALENAFDRFEHSRDFFYTLSKSRKKLLLSWIALAKTEVTIEKRILEIAENAGQSQLPKTFRAS
ncbi:MAG: YdeI/OmpD-associated family protein [Saprospiraceae bacterium]|nr:YdeI/OmpD-associated family protein [Saprospiraceae bacterium]